MCMLCLFMNIQYMIWSAYSTCRDTQHPCRSARITHEHAHTELWCIYIYIYIYICLYEKIDKVVLGFCGFAVWGPSVKMHKK